MSIDAPFFKEIMMASVLYKRTGSGVEQMNVDALDVQWHLDAGWSCNKDGVDKEVKEDKPKKKKSKKVED